jgi:hypothetical protein
LTEAHLQQVADYECSDLSEREKWALRYIDQVKYNPQGVTDEFMAGLRHYFTDAEINELAVTVMSYSIFHHWRSSIGEDVVDEHGVSLADPDGPFGRDGFFASTMPYSS